MLRTMMIGLASVAIGAAAFLATAGDASAASTWSSWSKFNNYLDWSTTLVSRDFEGKGNHFWTWRFRNRTSNKTVTYFKFRIYEYKANGRTVTSYDYLPGSLRPGQGIGGWAAFDAVGRSFALQGIEIKVK